MAMTPEPTFPGTARERSSHAAQAYKARADDRWVEIEDRVLARALATTRRSMPVRAASADGPVTVSEQVLVAGIRSAIAGVRGATPVAIRVHADDQNRYTGVLILIRADYGTTLLPVADEIRELARQALDTLLGPLDPPITVRTMQVHVDDVRATTPDEHPQA